MLRLRPNNTQSWLCFISVLKFVNEPQARGDEDQTISQSKRMNEPATAMIVVVNRGLRNPPPLCRAALRQPAEILPGVAKTGSHSRSPKIYKHAADLFAAPSPDSFFRQLTPFPSTTLRVLSEQGDPMGNDMISNALLATWSPRVLSVLRIVAALLFLQHGLAKLLHFPHIAMFDQLQLFSLLGLAGIIELVGSALLLVGLFTRPVALIMSGEMAVAYFMAHAPRGFFPIQNQGELAILFCFVFLYLAAAGGGPWSVDAMGGKKTG